MTRSRVLDLGAALALAALLGLGPAGPAPAGAESLLGSAPSSASDPAMCRADEPAGSLPPGGVQAHVIERLREAMLAGDPREVVVLDGRGHNYRRQSDPLAELAILQEEARRQRQ